MKQILIIISVLLTGMAHADSKRIEVFPVSQAYVDVKRGDTLGEIVQRVLPNTPSKHQQIMKEIVDLNPDAFIGDDINMLKANVRLWLPGYVSGLQQSVDRKNIKPKNLVGGIFSRLSDKHLI